MSTLPHMVFLLARTQPWYFGALIVLQCVQGFVPLFTAWTTKRLLDVLTESLQHRQAASDALLMLLVILAAQAGALVLNQSLSPVSTALQTHLYARLTLEIKTGIYSKIAGFVGLAYFEDPAFQNTIQISADNAQSGPQQTLRTLTTLLQGGVTLVSFLGVLVSFHPWLALLLGGAVLPQLYAELRFGRQRFWMLLSQGTKQRLVAYYEHVLTWTPFAKEVRLFYLGDYFLRKFVRTSQEIYAEQRSQQKRELGWHLLLGGFSTLVSSGIFIFVVLQTFVGALSLGEMVFYTSAVASVEITLANIFLTLSTMQDSIRFFQHYQQLLALPQPLPLSSSPRAVDPLHTGITFRDVSFRYGEQHPWILRHVNLFLPAKQCVALVGLNGAGKTTLVKLLTRLYDPTEGQILWDGIDLRAFDPDALRQHMGAIFQDFTRYELSARENIGLGKVDQIDEMETIQRAARKARIHERIERLPQGYESILSRMLAEDSTGVDLSGGEWQKVALARMFMRDAEVLILDEPTAALDAEAEYALYQHFKDLMRGHTCLLITHRFSTVRIADCIAILENGQITELGTHADLVAREGTYARLYGLQAESYR